MYEATNGRFVGVKFGKMPILKKKFLEKTAAFIARIVEKCWMKGQKEHSSRLKLIIKTALIRLNTRSIRKVTYTLRGIVHLSLHTFG